MTIPCRDRAGDDGSGSVDRSGVFPLAHLGLQSILASLFLARIQTVASDRQFRRHFGASEGPAPFPNPSWRKVGDLRCRHGTVGSAELSHLTSSAARSDLQDDFAEILADVFPGIDGSDLDLSGRVSWLKAQSVSFGGLPVHCRHETLEA